MSEIADVFKFAAKAGALEGYLFKRDKVEPLANWVGNVEGMYRSLTPAAKNEVRDELKGVVQRALEYGDRTLGPELKGKLARLLDEVQKPV